MLPTHYFSIEDAPGGQYRITARRTTFSPILTSTRLTSVAQAQEAMHALILALTQDWNYIVVNRDRVGPRFVIELQRPRATCISRAYTSCDAMEREIASIKSRAMALSIAPLQGYDIGTPSRKMRRNGDEEHLHAARLAALA